MNVRQLQRQLADSSDPKIFRVLELVDGMENRGEADALIAPLRDRLRHLRPARRLRFGRLLFLPFDHVIVPPLHWRPDQTALPRSALPPLIALVRDAFGPAAQEIDDALLAGMEPLDTVGERLWPRAGPVLLEASRRASPASWSESGLPGRNFAVLAGAVGGVLAKATTLRQISARHAASREEVGSFLVSAAEAGQDALCLAAVLLLHAAPGSRRLIQGTSGLPAAVIDRAIESVLDHAGAVFDQGDDAAVDLDEAVVQARHTADLFESLQDGAGPRRQARIAAMREDAAGVFGARLEKDLREELIEPAQHLPPFPSDTEILTLEHQSRTLRELEVQARRFGKTDQIDRVMRRSLDQLATSGLQGADLIRTVEILLGPEAALSLMRRTPQ